MYIYIYTRRPLQSVERVRLQPSKSPMLFNIQAQAARQQPKQPRMTHACSSPGWMVQDLINYFSYRDHSSLQSRATGVHRGPQAFSGRQTSSPHMLPFGPPGPSDWRSRLHGSAKWLIGAPCLTQWNPHATQSLPSSDPNEAKGSKMEPKVIAIQAQRSPSRATWSSKHPILSDSSLRGRRQRR